MTMMSDDEQDFIDMLEARLIEADEDYDFEDIDCESCALKFYIRPSLYKEREDGTKKEWPHQCDRCKKGLPPLYEY